MEIKNAWVPSNAASLANSSAFAGTIALLRALTGARLTLSPLSTLHSPLSYKPQFVALMRKS